MDAEILNTIKTLYIEKNYKEIYDRANENLNYFDEIESKLTNIVKDVQIEKGDIYGEGFAQIWSIDYHEFHMGEKNIVHYGTDVYISQIYPAYYLFHNFWMNQNNKNAWPKNLSGKSDEAWTFDQEKIENIIFKFFQEKGLLRLFSEDMNEVVPDVLMPENIKIYGKQMTVENCLFRDIYQLGELINN
jgi:hypothetical protein